MLAEYEAEVRRDAKKMWWKSFDFHPGAALECRFGLGGDSAEWYPVFVVETLDRLPKDTSRLEFDPKLFKPDIGLLVFHTFLFLSSMGTCTSLQLLMPTVTLARIMPLLVL